MTGIAASLLALLLASSAAVDGTEPAPSGPYDPAGRRDPFLPLIAQGVPGPVRGVEDLPWRKLVLVGILDEPGAPPTAVFLGGPSPQGWFLRPGTRFRDGTLESIDPWKGRVVIRGERPRAIGPAERHVLDLAPRLPDG